MALPYKLKTVYDFRLGYASGNERNSFVAGNYSTQFEEPAFMIENKMITTISVTGGGTNGETN